MLRYILLFSVLLSFIFTQAQTVIRGPYLQTPTHESVIVMWRTNNATSSKIWYGTDSSNLSLSSTASGNYTDHSIQINNLQPYTKYYYRIGDINGPFPAIVSQQYFRTHPIPGTVLPTRIWATGDFGRGNAGQVAMKQAFENYSGSREADVWIWLGDNAYNDGTDEQYQSKVFAVNGFSDIFPHLPFYPSPGNHDYNTVWAESTTLGIPYTNIPLENHQGPYYDLIDVPEFAEAGGYPSQLEVFYSFDYGDVHFLSLNSEVFDYTFSYDGINRMKQWIENDLQQNTRKFTIAYFHQPPYSKGSHDSDDAYELVMKAMREKVIPLLEQYDLDLIVCGHSHVFERSYLLQGHYGNSGSFNASTMVKQGGINGNFDEGTPYIKDNSYSTGEGTVYVVCGNSGSSESSPSLDHPAMYFGHGDSDAMGSFIIDINRNRLDGKYLTKEGVVADQFTILKKDLVVSAITNKTICEGDSVEISALYTGGSADIDFHWSVINQTDSVVKVSPPVTTQYTLVVTDNLTGQTDSVIFSVVVLPNPSAVITEPITGVLAAPTGTNVTYQWYINGSLISGATNQYYEPLFSGTYHVVITNTINGCSIISDEYTYAQSSLGIGDQNLQSFQLYPNPAANQITLVIPKEMMIGQTSFYIADISGKKVLEGTLKDSVSNIQLHQLHPGIYYLTITTGSLNIQQSFSKQ